MNSLVHACCSGSIRSVAKGSSCGYFYPCNSSLQYPGARTLYLESWLTKVLVQCYSTKKSGGVRSRKKKLKAETEPANEPLMKYDNEAFFVVRKGNLIGVYKSLSDCQAQVGTSICDPPASVYKGYSMPKDTKEYLLSCGLKNALYSIRAADLTSDLFGSLEACTFQQPSSKDEASKEPMIEEQESMSSGGYDGQPSWRDETPKEPMIEEQESMSSGGYHGQPSWRDETPKEPMIEEQESMSSGGYHGQSCTLEFDGASKGNPGQAGAGAILRADNGSLICRLSEGLGVTTNNIAEYRAIILGLRFARKKGFTSIRARGDSKLVCMQIQGLWKVKNKNISIVCEEAKKLKNIFTSFEIYHVLRNLNADADAQANLAVDLPEGHVTEAYE